MFSSRRPLDVYQLPDLTVDEILHVKIEEPPPTSGIVARDGLGKPAAHDSVCVIGTSDI